MEQKSIREVAAWTGGRYLGPDLPVAGVSIDSRHVRPGDLFIPLRGAHNDGHAFLGEAFASGAAAALVDRAEIARTHTDLGHPVIVVEDNRAALGCFAAAYRRRLGLTVVGVTGSNGKTTTKEMLRLLLGSRAAVSPKSFNNDIGVPLTLLSADRTHSVCVVEMGTNQPGEIAALSEIARPDVGVVLNVAESHLQGLGDLDGIAREKFALIDALGREGCAVLNWDDSRTRDMIGRTDSYVISFGTWPDADVYAGDVRTRGSTLSFRLFHRMKVEMRLLGVHNVHNALAAASVAMWLGSDPGEVCDRLEEFQPAPMRMSVEDIGRTRLINDAYNANPRSMSAAILEVSYRGGGRRVAVLGDMLELGTRAEELHMAVGEQLAQSKIDVLWAIGPLSEATAQAARSAGLKEVHWSPDVRQALQDPPFQPRSRDVVLFKASRGVGLERVYEAVRDDLVRRRRTTARS
ncbi:MAG: UDP-N-acetylmuramoyl-tripeptide--D-alanyl-D-alanine ligase [Planctomycetota bacterium]|jgi:UDP-N-acetylmuramoyl-tripeptide--D-alanyl-D-alanine ligase